MRRLIDNGDAPAKKAPIGHGHLRKAYLEMPLTPHRPVELTYCWTIRKEGGAARILQIAAAPQSFVVE